MEGLENKRRKPKLPKRYVCAKCGRPLVIHRCWIGNDGLLCAEHVVFRPEEKAEAGRAEKPPPSA